MPTRLIVIAAVGVLAILGQWTVASAQVDQAATVRRFYDAFNRGDTLAVMALFTDDAIWQGTGPCARVACSGKAAIQQEIERNLADHTSLTVVGLDIRDSSVSDRIEVRSDSE